MPDAAPTAAELADLLHSATRAFRQAVRLGGGPLPPHQGRALHIVCEEGAVRPARLAERLHVTPRSVTDVIDALVEAGFVSRGPDPGDRRAQLVEPTDRGRAVEERSREVRAEVAGEFFGGLSEADRAELGRLLGALLP
ncbi:DNA-binding transcriptional regulator, MarR family [Raineyella antarctica]|uniref:DNA-binding transcriptional regulator, MarR family n=1 Tax=Raineyella antarctica TaxID=1577474 RepID=A0A1G6GH30_9ACTN|nr:MarR family transcriptional regulator [Raineyella antarctica]SDB81250.1 DNA-binding transcriptional regulator, MarR family [Raineyella antarctica]